MGAATDTLPGTLAIFNNVGEPRKPVVCTENLIRIDCVTESPKR